MAGRGSQDLAGWVSSINVVVRCVFQVYLKDLDQVRPIYGTGFSNPFDVVSDYVGTRSPLGQRAGEEPSSTLQGEISRIGAEGHALARHGGTVTDEQLFIRATTGVAPDGSAVVRDGQTVIPPSSTAFSADSLLAESDVFIRTNYLDRAIALSKPGTARLTIEGINTGTVVGRGYDRVSVKPGVPGPLQYFDNLTRVTAVYEFDAVARVWRTVTIYPVK